MNAKFQFNIFDTNFIVSNKNLQIKRTTEDMMNLDINIMNVNRLFDDNKLRINFTVSTRSNIISSFQYVVEAIGANEMIFSFVQNGTTNYYYFSTRKQYN